MMKTYFFIQLSILFSFLLSGSSYAQHERSVELSIDSNYAWIKQYLGNAINEKNVVGLGEVSHGASEPFLLKAEIVKFLVEEKGFRTLFFELDDASLREIDSCINDDSSINSDRIDSLFLKISFGEVFNSLELLNTFKWLKSYNSSHEGDKVRLRGMDIDIDLNYFKTHYFDPDYYQELKRKWKGKTLNTAVQYQIANSWYERRKDSLKKSLLPKIYLQLKYDMENFRISSKVFQGGGIRDSLMFKLRDSMMFRNINLLKSEKAIVWAHNAHVSNSGFILHRFRAKNLGNFLREFYNSKYYIILTDYTNKAKIKALKGDNVFVKQLQSDKKSAAAMINNQFKTAVRLIFSSQFKNLNLPYTFNNISLEGRPFILKGDINSFDAILVFKNLNPTTSVE